MKTLKTYILLIIAVILLINTAKAQILKGKSNKESYTTTNKMRFEEIDGDKYKGWVFIDGKYIDAPYKVERRGRIIYINGIQVEKKIEEEKDPFAINGRIGYPPNLNDSSSLEDLINTQHEKLGLPFQLINCDYFFKNYKYEEALDSIVAYFKNAPNVSSVELKSNTKLFITSKKGVLKRFGISTRYNKQISEKWGPNGTGPIPLRELIKQADIYIESLIEELEENGIFFCITSFENNKYILSDYNFLQCAPLIYNITLKDKSENYLEELKMCLYSEDYIQTFMKNPETSKQFERRLELLQKHIENYNKQRTSGQLNLKNNETHVKDTKSLLTKSTKIIKQQ